MRKCLNMKKMVGNSGLEPLMTKQGSGRLQLPAIAAMRTAYLIHVNNLAYVGRKSRK